jgi:hypothetical protein
MNSEEYNKFINTELNSKNTIPFEIIKSFTEAYDYNAATSINWLISKIKIIKARIDNGDILEAENNIEKVIFLLNKETFPTWIKNKYPEVYEDLFS